MGASADYAALFDLSSELMALAGADGELWRVNLAWNVALGLDPDELVGRKLSDLVLEEDREAVEGAVTRAGEGGVPPQFDARIRDRDGEIRRVVGRVRRSGPRLLLTARVRGERGAPVPASEVSLELARFTFERAPDPILFIGPEAELRYVNHEACRTYKYTRDELLQMTVHDLDESATPAGWPVHWEHLAKVGSMTVQSVHRRSDGSRLPVELRLNYLDFHGQEFNCAIVRDMTERVETERALKEKTTELETLLYVTSHDLREPLRAIRGFSGMLAKRYAGALDDRGRDLVERIRKGGDRLDQLLQDLLMMSRLQGEQRSLEMVDLGQVVTDVIARLELSSRDSPARLTVGEELPTVVAHRGWATQAIYNLIANALKFTTGGEAPDVEVVAFRCAPDQPGDAGIIVRDRGPGIAPEHAERIFAMFQRAVGREVEGTGAGLAIVRRIARKHGGDVWHAPREGGGSEFYLSFIEPAPEAS